MIQLIQGDCLTEMQNIESGSVDAIITDPPYGTTACKWDSVIDFELMWEQLNRIIKPNGAIVLFGSEPFSALRMSNIKNYKYDWVWEKNFKTGHLNAKIQPMRSVENISIFYKKQPVYNAQGLKIHNKIKDRGVGAETNNKCGTVNIQSHTGYPHQLLKFNRDNGKSVHPTQKPVALMEYLIKTYTNENETVLDFTMGSGSTGVAAKNLNRSFIGIEQDPNYFKIAEERINKPDLFTLDTK
jgi:DNA modification methylase